MDYTHNTDINVGSDIATHLMRDSLNFLTNIGFPQWWVVVVRSLLLVLPQEVVCRGKIRRVGRVSSLNCC